MAGAPLFLTPLIRTGSIQEARTLCKVEKLPKTSPDLPERESYSGYITVNEEHDSNLFFWFFPAKNDPKTAPLILYLDGGPGFSTFCTLFTQNGPYIIQPDGQLTEKEWDWTLNQSMIYIESPVGVGYSFGKESGYSYTSEDAATNIVEFVDQFFQLFPDYLSQPLYIAGASYGGKFAPPVALALHQKNKSSSSKSPKTNLSGLLLFFPWTNPLVQAKYGDFLVNLGLIDKATLPHFHSEEEQMRQFMIDQDYPAAFDVWSRLVSNLDGSSAFHKSSGFTRAFNVLHDGYDFSSQGYIGYANDPEFRRAVHAGDKANYEWLNMDIFLKMSRKEFMASKSCYIEQLLEDEGSGVQVIIATGQLDLTVIHSGVEALIEEFNWGGREEFKLAPRTVWRDSQNTVAGYEKKARNLVYVLIRNAGHMPGDQPEWTLDMMKRHLKRGGGKQ